MLNQMSKPLYLGEDYVQLPNRVMLLTNTSLRLVGFNSTDTSNRSCLTVDPS